MRLQTRRSLVCPPQRPHLVDLPLLLLHAGLQLGAGRRPLRRVAQSEVGVAEVSVSFNVVKRLPNHALLLQEALVRHQEVQVSLRGEQTALGAATPERRRSAARLSPPCV